MSDTPDDPEWTCRRCGSHRWVAASLTGPVSHGGRAIRQCVPCGWYSNDPVGPPPHRHAYIGTDVIFHGGVVALRCVCDCGSITHAHVGDRITVDAVRPLRA